MIVQPSNLLLPILTLTLSFSFGCLSSSEACISFIITCQKLGGNLKHSVKSSRRRCGSWQTWEDWGGSHMWRELLQRFSRTILSCLLTWDNAHIKQYYCFKMDLPGLIVLPATQFACMVIIYYWTTWTCVVFPNLLAPTWLGAVCACSDGLLPAPFHCPCPGHPESYELVNRDAFFGASGNIWQTTLAKEASSWLRSTK